MTVTTNMMRTIDRRGALVAAVLAIAAAVSIVARVPGSAWLPLHLYLVPVLLCATGLSLLAYPAALALINHLQRLTPRGRYWVTAAGLAAGLVVIFAWPIDPAPDSIADLSVSVLDGKNEQAQGREVWVRLERDGQNVPIVEFKQKGAWMDKAPFLVASDPKVPTAVQWRGSYSNNLRLIFISHSWSGRARVIWNGQQRDVDLYDANGKDAWLDIGGIAASQTHVAFPDRNLRQWFTAGCDVLLFGTLGLLVFLSLVHRRDALIPARSSRSMTVEAALYAAPLALSSVVSVLVFYPAMMTSDSLDQWRQAGRFAFNDAHPVLYGLFVAAMRSLWDSPASVALVQSALLAASCGWLVAVVRRATCASAYAAWLSALLVALYPLLPMTAITLWKDVPYAAATVALTALVVSRLFSPSDERIGTGETIGLSILMFCAMVLRHNGPPVAMAAALILLVFSKPSRLRVIVAASAAVAMMLLLKGPVSDAIGVQRSPFSYAVYSHHIGAHLAAGNLPDDPADRAILTSINSKQADWAYNCATINPTIFNPEFNVRRAIAHDDDLLRIMLGLARKRPDVEYYHGLCASGLIWRVRDLGRDPLYLSGVGLWAPQGRVTWITSAPGDPVMDSKSPQLAEFLGQMVLTPAVQASFRPAMFMYLLIFAGAVALLRRRDRRLLAVLCLPAVHTAFLAVSIIAQDARYQLPLYAIALATAPLLLGARSTENLERSP